MPRWTASALSDSTPYQVSVVALEVKLSRNVADADTRHLKWLRDRIGDRLVDAAVITVGRDAYRRRDGIAVVPAVLLGP